MEQQRFEVLNSLPSRAPGPRRFILLRDNWNDWFEYETTFQLLMDDETGSRTTIGNVKIGRIGMTPNDRKPPIPDSFETLDSSFFSVGQDENYYETIANLPLAVGTFVFEALRDCAYDPTIFQQGNCSTRCDDRLAV